MCAYLLTNLLSCTELKNAGLLTVFIELSPTCQRHAKAQGLRMAFLINKELLNKGAANVVVCRGVTS